MSTRTLSIIKPDATRKNITGAVNKFIEEAGFKIVAQKRILLTISQAEMFYKEHRGKSFFDDTVRLMSSCPCVVQVLEKENAVEDYRKIMGATDPQKAEKGTIRATFGKGIDENVVHGSDSPESAQREIAFFFSELEIVG